MQSLNRPPGRGSVSHEWMVKPFGPNQCCRCSARVQHANTRSRGASKTRVSTTVCWFIADSFCDSFCEIRLELIQRAAPTLGHGGTALFERLALRFGGF